MLRPPYFPTDLKLTPKTLPLYEQLLAAHLEQLLIEANQMPEPEVDTDFPPSRCYDPYAALSQKVISMRKKIPTEMALRIGLTDEVVVMIQRERARRFLAWMVRVWQYWAVQRQRRSGWHEIERIKRTMRKHNIPASEIGFPVS